MSNVASNPDYKTITYKKYSYILPKVKNMFSRAREYIKDRINVIKTKTMTMTKTKKQDDVHFNYIAFKGGKGKQIRKRKSRIQTRKQTRKQTKKQTKKFTKRQTKKQNRRKNKKIKN